MSLIFHNICCSQQITNCAKLIEFQEISNALLPYCSVLIAVHSLEVVLLDQFDGFFLADGLCIFEVVIADGIDHISQIRLDLQPLEVLNDDHGYLSLMIPSPADSSILLIEALTE